MGINFNFLFYSSERRGDFFFSMRESCSQWVHNWKWNCQLLCYFHLTYITHSKRPWLRNKSHSFDKWHIAVSWKTSHFISCTLFNFGLFFSFSLFSSALFRFLSIRLTFKFRYLSFLISFRIFGAENIILLFSYPCRISLLLIDYRTVIVHPASTDSKSAYGNELTITSSNA